MKLSFDLLRPTPLRERIFFLHIPKCAGLSFFRALANCYGLQTLIHPGTVVYLDANAALQGAQVLDEDPHDLRERLLAYYMSSPECHCLGGHFPYSQKAFEAFSDEWRFTTLLRDPLDMWFSHHGYFKRTVKPNHPWFEFANLDLDAFLDTPAASAMGSSIVDALTRNDGFEESGSAAAVDLALRRLQRFSLVGKVENLTDFAQRFETRFGSPLRIPHINRASRTRLGASSVSTAALSRIKELIRPNQALYDGTH